MFKFGMILAILAVAALPVWLVFPPYGLPLAAGLALAAIAVLSLT